MWMALWAISNNFQIEKWFQQLEKSNPNQEQMSSKPLTKIQDFSLKNTWIEETDINYHTLKYK